MLMATCVWLANAFGGIDVVRHSGKTIETGNIKIDRDEVKSMVRELRV